MKIEKLNDNQIRCTLNKHDLIDRELKLSELAYGTEKAKGLFRDMMEQAFDEFGFEAEDIPLVIEAIPVSAECIILIVTKVEDPEELDTRFAKFTPDVEDSDEDSSEDSEHEDMFMDIPVMETPEGEQHVAPPDIMNLLKKITEEIVGEDVTVSGHLIPLSPSAKEAVAKAAPTPKKVESSGLCVFSFQSLNEVSALCNVIRDLYTGPSTLYKNTHTKAFYLTLEKSEDNMDLFKKIVGIASEYGQREKCSYATLAYYDEHYDKIVKRNAVEIMADL